MKIFFHASCGLISAMRLYVLLSHLALVHVAPDSTSSSSTCFKLLSNRDETKKYSYCGILSNLSGNLHETLPTIVCGDIKYWWNLIWWCVHDPPRFQIKFPTKFLAIE